MENLVYDLERAVWDKFRDESPTSAEPADFSYDEVAENVGARGEAILKKTVCYIVSAVVLHKDRVLMMKEAKKSCRGQWYLPAGRLERNESLEEGVMREVLEETGLYFQPSYLVCVDSQGTSWFRFTFAGSITGGELKRLEDKESLEAGWFTVPEISSSLQLRCRDILPLIDAGLKRYGAKQELVYKVLPEKKPHKHVILRFVIVKKVEKNNSKSLDVLLFKKAGSNSRCFPFAVSRSDGQNVASMTYSSIKKANKQAEYKVHGYLGVEHTGKPQGQADGLCLTVLVEMLSGSQQGNLSDEYEWFSVEQQGLTENILQLIEVKGCIDWQFDF